MAVLAHQKIEVSPPEAFAAHEAGEGILVDVREPFEWANGYAAGARRVSLYNLPAEADQLPKEQALLFICASGNRSYQAAKYFRSLGYDARSVAGGTAAWQLHRLPVQV